jgi:aminopeptidase N
MTCEYDQKARTYQIDFSQSCPPTPGQEHKEPYAIPIVLGLLGADGRPLTLTLKGSDQPTHSESITLELKERHQSFIFTGIPVKPVPSVFRDFSAPVKLHHNLTKEDLLFLMSHDSDAFNRWEAAQHLLTMTILNLVEEKQRRKLNTIDLKHIVTDRIQGIVKGFQQTLADTGLENEIKCQTLTLPGEQYLSEQMAVIDIESIHAVHEAVKRSLAQALEPEFLPLYHVLNNRDKAGYDPESAGIRSLKNLALDYLMVLENSEIYELCSHQFAHARTMTDEMKALTFIVNEDITQRDRVLKNFYLKWRHDSVVMNIWLMIQATSKLTTVKDIKKLLQHPVFEIHNPNRVRALIGAFVTTNLINFHLINGEGYALLTELVLTLNKINPQIASRLLNPFARWRKFEKTRQSLIKEQLETILQNPGISKDVYEIASKYLV